ncbi:MAG: hypothetical protein BGO98_44120 [Myxococcales bacterium 68-20]|nr:hypothetical protein [Myxococcales bacterium]OJY26912.1 MAG: hypothetical protein BGO98_44120 [Myxococcales bacterium 68-20]
MTCGWICAVAFAALIDDDGGAPSAGCARVCVDGDDAGGCAPLEDFVEVGCGEGAAPGIGRLSGARTTPCCPDERVAATVAEAGWFAGAAFSAGRPTA